MACTVAELATRLGCELRGDPETRISGVGTLAVAGPEQLSFFANRRYRDALKTTAAGAVLLSEQDLPDCPANALIHDNPYAAYARAAAWLHPQPEASAGVHTSAVVASSARIDPGAEIGPCAVVGEDTEIGAGTVIAGGAVLGAHCRVGAGCRIGANVTLCDNVTLGERVIVHPGAVIGADGFGLAREPEGWLKVPQLGGVRIGNDVEIGACTSIDCGAIEDTVIADGVKLDNQIQVAHNVRIGEHTVVAACAGISGSTVIGRRCVIAGMVGFVGHIEVADDVVVTGRSMVSRSLDKAGTYSGALPVDEAGRWRRNSARFRKLDELTRSVRALEKQVKTLISGGKKDD